MLGATHVLKLEVEWIGIDKNKDMHVSILVIHLLDSWWFYVLQGVKSHCISGLVLLFCMAMRHILT